MSAASPLALAAANATFDEEDDAGYEETARVVRVSLIRGDVSLRRAGSKNWEKATLNLPLVEGDRLATGADARLEIQIDARNFIRLGEYATLDIVTLRDEGVALSLPEGTATLRLASFDDKREYFEIDAPKTTLAAEQKGSYRLDVAQNGNVRAQTATGNYPARVAQTTGMRGLTNAKVISPRACATTAATATTTRASGARKNLTPTAIGSIQVSTATCGVRM
ncbi:MAG: FecR domain-containing protein [Acidobacteria bacterium]|nr:FecR domain-containing protein [Acidobacteriota bacterium]